MSSFDTARLLTQIVIKGALPDGRFTDNELLDFAYDALLAELTPMVMQARQDYYIVSQDTAVGTASSFAIPYRAQNGVLREVKIVRGSQIIDLDRVKLDDITTSALGTPDSFYIQGNNVGLYPAPASDNGDILRLYYWVRPSRLVTVSETAKITAIVGTTLTISAPSTWTTANTFDLVRGRAHFDLLAVDQTASSVTSTSITFASLPSGLVVGDVVCLAEETSYPNLPPEGHIALVQCAVTTALEAMADPAAGNAAQKAQLYKQTFADTIKIRVEGAQLLGKRLL